MSLYSLKAREYFEHPETTHLIKISYSTHNRPRPLYKEKCLAKPSVYPAGRVWPTNLVSIRECSEYTELQPDWNSVEANVQKSAASASGSSGFCMTVN